MTADNISEHFGQRHGGGRQRYIAEIAKTAVSPAQRGFVEGMSIEHNTLDMEGSQYSQLLHALPAIALFDFAQSFPSLAHMWTWYVLPTLGSSQHLIWLTECLHHVLTTFVFHNRQRFNTFSIRAGLRQACPMSGSLFVVCANPRAWRSWWCTLGASACSQMTSP